MCVCVCFLSRFLLPHAQSQPKSDTNGLISALASLICIKHFVQKFKVCEQANIYHLLTFIEVTKEGECQVERFLTNLASPCQTIRNLATV